MSQSNLAHALLSALAVQGLDEGDAFFAEVREEPDAAGGDIRIRFAENLGDHREGLGAETLQRVEAEVTDVDGRITQHGGGAFAAICGFVALHCIGARWLYSNVPYDAWAQMLTGWSPNAAFGWQRNHFDRFIHLIYGLCFTPAVWHWLRQRWPSLAVGHAFAVTVMLIMCTSLLYEWLEWGIALTMSPEAAESYNGQQGDVWDAHADMLLATVGALLVWPLARAERRGTPA